jgi:predicted MFS family arabinose efflux permease
MISDKADLLAANGLGHASSSLAEMLGLALGGVIVAKLGIPAALFADSFSFLFYAAAIVFAVIPATKAGAPGQPVAHHFWSEFRGGLREAFGNNMVRLAIIMGLFLNFMVSPYNIIAPIYADKVLAAGAGGYAIMETAITAAMMLGALVVGQFSRRLSYRAILITGTALIGVGFGLMAVLPNLPIALISSALLGIGSGSLNTAVGGMFVTQCPQELIGRVSSVAGSLMMAAMPAATAVAGTAADLVPATGIFAGIGVMVLVVAAALSFSKALRAQARANQPESNAA